MKLKFRADAKDWKKFVIFSLALFYIVALLVLNITSFITDGILHGFNPFPVFSREFFAPTMVFFIAALITVFTGVSSYFFDREKGIGIKTTAK